MGRLSGPAVCIIWEEMNKLGHPGSAEGEGRGGAGRGSGACPRRAAELQFYTSAAAVAMLVPAWIFFMVSPALAPSQAGASPGRRAC